MLYSISGKLTLFFDDMLQAVSFLRRLSIYPFSISIQDGRGRRRFGGRWVPLSIGELLFLSRKQ